ncbi:MAG: hypothetical protein J6L77_09040 [Coprococcus sp.]|nr:hypothetical protein [Coprococcus sp.]
MLGYLKGIEIKNFTKRKIEKMNFEEVLDGMVSADILRKQMLAAFDDSKNEGRVYAFYKKKKMVACYIICNVPLVNVEKDEKNKENKVKRNYELRYHYIIEECGHLQEEMEKCVLAELKELAALYDIENIILGDKIYEKKKVKVGNTFVPTFLFAIAIGIGYGILFDNIPLGISIGILFGLTFGYAFVPSTTVKLEEKESEHNAINESSKRI